MKSRAIENLNNGTLPCVEGNSYPVTEILGIIHFTVLCVAKGKKRHMKSLARKFFFISVYSVAIELLEIKSKKINV